MFTTLVYKFSPDSTAAAFLRFSPDSAAAFRHISQASNSFICPVIQTFGDVEKISFLLRLGIAHFISAVHVPEFISDKLLYPGE